MNTSQITRSNIKNIRYNVSQIEQAAREQLDYDLTHFQMIDDATRRIDMLGCIGGACFAINLQLDLIEANLKHAEDIVLPPVE